MISVKNLSISYEEKTALHNVSLDFESGKATGIIGANGAGKSSLLKACVGLLPDFEGTVHFGQKDLRENRYWVKEHCAYAPEDVELLPYMKGREFLQLVAALRGAEHEGHKTDELLDMLALRTVENELIINYSHGMRQKLSLAAALTGETDYLILDESLNGLDALSLFGLKNYFAQLLSKGKTIVLSSHIISLIQSWCDPVVIMDRGEVLRVLSAREITELERQKGKSFAGLFIEMVSKG